MPQRSYLWTTRLCGVVLYSLVFVFTCHTWQVGPGPLRGQPELLLFMLPGILMALLQVESPLKSTLLMGLWGTLLAALLLNSSLFPYTTLFRSPRQRIFCARLEPQCAVLGRLRRLAGAADADRDGVT